MRICTFCGSDSFEEVDGYYYCVDCNRQSQESQSVLRESNVGQETFYAGDELDHDEGNNQEKQKGSGPPLRRYYVDGGVPWIPSEAIGFIFKCQVECVITNGAHTSLRNIAYRLWALYISKLGLAFVEDPLNLELPYFKIRPTRREIMPPTLDNPWVLGTVLSYSIAGHQMATHSYQIEIAKDDNFEESTPIDPVSSEDELNARKMRVSSSLIATRKWHKLVVPAAINEEIEEGDMNIRDVVTGAMNRTYEEVLKGKRKYARLKFRRAVEQRLETRKSKRYIEGLTPYRWIVNKTLCLLYLSLSFSGHYVTPGMILRWAQLGLIPYRNMKSCLPPEIVFQTLEDTQLFTERLPSLVLLTNYVRYLTDFMEIEVFPLPPFELVVANCIDRLYLPRDFYNFVLSLIEKVPICRSDWRRSSTYATDFDSLALAYVLAALRSVFALDDAPCEKRFTALLQKLQGLLTQFGSDFDYLQPFAFNDWLPLFESFVDVQKKSDNKIDYLAFDRDSLLPERFSKFGKITRPGLTRDRQPLFAKAREELKKTFHAMEANLADRLRPSQQTNVGKEFSTAPFRDKLSDFQIARSAYFSVTSFKELLRALNIGNVDIESRFINPAIESQIDEVLEQIQQVLDESTSTKFPFDARAPLEPLSQQAPLYYRTLTAACHALLAPISLDAKNIHRLICVVGAYATGEPCKYLGQYMQTFRRKHFSKPDAADFSPELEL